ncbi:galactose oxidase [Aspergillus karnatakaensis]|uniref:Kelch repeat-containing protein n=1 Tax=Aspergillus karnatakaensis TaxID=1810916 RepID=UPI003CCD6BCE
MLSTVVTALLLLVSSCEALPTSETSLLGKWSTLPNITRDGTEYPRQEHAAVLVGDEIYVLGGILPFDGKEYATTNLVQKYNTITKTWTETAPMPAALNHANVAVVDNKIYCLGGLEAIDETYWNATGKSAVYDPATDEWTVLPGIPEGREIGSAATLVRDDTIYLPGGLAFTNITFDQEGTVSRFTSYNVKTQEWKILPDLPAPRDHAGKGIYQDILYILGGREFGNKNVVSTVFGFNLTSHEWSATSYEPMPIARGGVASATIGSQIFTAGGEGDRRTPNAVFPEMQAYDAATNTWISYADMPLPIHGSDAVVYKGEIVIPGGGIVTGATLTPVVQTFQPPEQDLTPASQDLGEESMTLIVMVYGFITDLSWMLFKR